MNISVIVAHHKIYSVLIFFLNTKLKLVSLILDRLVLIDMFFTRSLETEFQEAEPLTENLILAEVSTDNIAMRFHLDYCRIITDISVKKAIDKVKQSAGVALFRRKST